MNKRELQIMQPWTLAIAYDQNLLPEYVLLITICLYSITYTSYNAKKLSFITYIMKSSTV